MSVPLLNPIAPYDFLLSLRVAASFSPEASQNQTILRTAVRLDKKPLVMEVRQINKRPVQLKVSCNDNDYIGTIKKLAEWVLFAELNLRGFYRVSHRNKKINHIVKRLHGLKPMRPASLFEMAVIAVIEQQISLIASYRIRERMIKRFGDSIDGLWAFPCVETLAEAAVDELMACGLSKRKAEYIRGLALKVCDRSVDLNTLKTMSDEDVRQYMTSIRGFGPWSADYILIRGLGRTDCVPANDLALRTTVGKYLGDGTRLSPEKVREVLEPFAPYRGMAAFYLLAYEKMSKH